jgi:hypothetical protein
MRFISSVAVVGLVAAMAFAASLALGEEQPVKDGAHGKIAGGVARLAGARLAPQQASAP